METLQASADLQEPHISESVHTSGNVTITECAQQVPHVHFYSLHIRFASHSYFPDGNIRDAKCWKGERERLHTHMRASDLFGLSQTSRLLSSYQTEIHLFAAAPPKPQRSADNKKPLFHGKFMYLAASGQKGRAKKETDTQRTREGKTAILPWCNENGG